jgi:hypothetical protein
MAPLIAAIVLFLALYIWSEAEVMRRTYDGWMVNLLFLADLLLLCAGFGPLFGLWRLFFNRMILTQWAPHVGLCMVPRWPAAPYLRGRRAGKRRFDEPMPWLAGPVTH